MTNISWECDFSLKERMRTLSMNFTMEATSVWEQAWGQVLIVKTVQVDYSTSVISESVQYKLWRAFLRHSPTSTKTLSC